MSAHKVPYLIFTVRGVWLVWVLVTACLLWPSSVSAQSCMVGARVACPCGDRAFMSGFRVCGQAGELGACVCPSVGARRVWYGQQVFVFDGLSLALVGAGLGVGGSSPSVGSGLVGVGGVVFSLGAPVVHWVHGHVARGFVSLLVLRGALPGVLGLVGYGIGVGASRGDPAVIALSSALLSILGAVIGSGIDGGVLAFDEVLR